MQFLAIGVYNSTEDEFFSKLSSNEIDTFCDIRQRRGVRGAKYAFVNSQRLQNRLSEMGIQYLHILDLAPTKEIRELQKAADAQLGEQKRKRNELGKIFTIAYKDRILGSFDFDAFIQQLEELNAKKVALFCVEEKPEACHRSIVAKKLEQKNYTIKHL